MTNPLMTPRAPHAARCRPQEERRKVQIKHVDTIKAALRAMDGEMIDAEVEEVAEVHEAVRPRLPAAAVAALGAEAVDELISTERKVRGPARASLTRDPSSMARC